MRVAKLGAKSLSRLRLARIVAITVIMIAFCGYLDHDTRSFDLFEQKTYGERLEVATRLNRALIQHAQQQIALVTISDQTFDQANQGHLPGPFIPRADHAKVIRALTRYGAKVIVFDMLFDTPQPGDAELAAAVQKSGRVLLACADKGDERIEIIPPERLLLNAGADQGHTRVPINPERPAIDRIQPEIEEGGHLVPALSVEAVRMALAGKLLRRAAEGRQLSPLSIPVNPDGTFNIRYISAPGNAFPSIPYETLLSGVSAEGFFPTFFKDKIVLIGDTTRIHGDLHMTPVGEMTGVEIQCHAIATLLERRFLEDAPWPANFMQIVVLSSLAALFVSVWRLPRAVLFLLVLLLVYFLFNVWIFVKLDLVLPLVSPVAALCLTAFGVVAERGIIEEQEKTRMRGLLQRYVSPQIAGHLLQHPELLHHAGKRTTGTVLFTDIRNFTALSEQLSPEELVSRMNEYFGAMTDIVFRHEGTASSIVGDAMLALFGVPVPSADHASHAVAAAIEMQQTMIKLQEKWRAHAQKTFDIGIGINTGEMVVGDVGGQQLMNFTVYGLQVNIASRVESLNHDGYIPRSVLRQRSAVSAADRPGRRSAPKRRSLEREAQAIRFIKKIRSHILITRATYESIAEKIEVRGPLLVPIKGMENPVEVFEVLGWRNELVSSSAPNALSPSSPALEGRAGS